MIGNVEIITPGGPLEFENVRLSYLYENGVATLILDHQPGSTEHFTIHDASIDIYDDQDESDGPIQISGNCEILHEDKPTGTFQRFLAYFYPCEYAAHWKRRGDDDTNTVLERQAVESLPAL